MARLARPRRARARSTASPREPTRSRGPATSTLARALRRAARRGGDRARAGRSTTPGARRSSAPAPRSTPSSPPRRRPRPTFRPRADLLEVAFGPSTSGDEAPAHEALALGDVTLRGRIDRIDVDPAGRRRRPRLQDRQDVSPADEVRQGGHAPDPALHAGRRAHPRPRPGRRPLPPARRGRRPRKPRGLVAREDDELKGARDRRHRPPRGRGGLRAGARRGRGARARAPPARCAPATIAPRPDRRQVPEVLHLPADLPARARHRRSTRTATADEPDRGTADARRARAAAADAGGARGRPKRAARSAAFEPTAEQRAAIAARERDAFLEAGAGTGKTTVLVDRYCDGDRRRRRRGRPRSSPSRSPSAPRPSCARGSAASSSPGARAAREAGDPRAPTSCVGAPRATERAWVMTIHAFCRRLLADAPARRGARPALPRARRGRGGAPRRPRRATRRSTSCWPRATRDVARAAAAYQPWRLVAMTVSAHARLRSQGMSEPRLPPVAEPVHSPRRRARRSAR